MLEVVFSDSEKGSMKIAKNYNKKDWLNAACAFGYIGEKPAEIDIRKEIEIRADGEAVGGSSQDVVGIGFALDVGNISGSVNGENRQDVFKKMWDRFVISDSERAEFFENQHSDVERLITSAKSGEKTRIWKSNAPYSLCGFYYVCFLLKDVSCEISVVSMPEYIVESENKIVSYNGFGEVEPGKLYKFLLSEKPLASLEKQMYANRWNTLINENAPLRANVNGMLISANEDFYDYIIEMSISDNNFVMASLIGNILTKYKIGISDSWYALRIDKMIEDKKLLVISDKDKSHLYGKILRKSTI